MKPNRYDRWVSSLRPAKRPPTLDEPVNAFVERETLPDRRCGIVGTVILSNRECPYRCVFCGLWRDTTDHTPPVGAVARQVEDALESFGSIDAVKLYNAGSFFDEEAIPARDRDRIGDLCRDIDWVVVESRPELIDQRALGFARRLNGRLQIAVGLEVADDQILALLNKRMTLAVVRRAGRFMRDHGLSQRAFIIVQPPLVSPSRAVELAGATADFAVHCGADTVTMIRAHSTPGAMEELIAHGFWRKPDIWSVYEAASYALKETGAVTLVDRWSVAQDENCPACMGDFDTAFENLNIEQRLPKVTCACRSDYLERMSADDVRGVDEYREYVRKSVLTLPTG